MDINGQGRETLSALFDGELEGDAARFAMKRLGHDLQWRQTLGHWQLLGDAMRGHATSVAPAGFAARVATALAAEACQTDVAMVPAAANGASRAHMVARRKWMGGAALAASVAMVAMFVARPFSQDAGMAPGVAVPAAAEMAAAPAPVPAETAPALPDPALAAVATVIAVAEVPRRASDRGASGQSQRVVLRASSRPVQTAVPATASAPTSVATVGPLAQPASNPFGPPPAEVVSRPWPRAVLPNATANPAFTASFPGNTASSPSFYPFEPRLPHASDAAPAPAAADERRR